MNKASGGDGIPVELFQILKDDAVKMLHSICQQIWKTQQWPQDWKRSLFIPIPKKSSEIRKTLSNQCKKIEENNKMEKTRDHFKKIRDTKGMFHAKMGSIKDRNGIDLTDAEDMKKRWQEYTGELYKKHLHENQIITMV